MALIAALLIAAIVALLGTALGRQQQIDIHRSGNLFMASQADAYDDAIADWSVLILEKDARESRQDSRNEAWATLLPPLPIDDGVLAARLEDLQGRFNLNRLLLSGTAGQLAQRRLERLLAVLELPASLADAILDWLDADTNARPGGAEDDFYSRGEPPYRAANQPLGDISELRLVRGMTQAYYARLSPHVCALPGSATLNVNTATPAVLSALLPDGTPGDVTALVAQQNAGGFASVENFQQHEIFGEEAPAATGLGVASGYFLLHARTLIDQLPSARRYLLHRDRQGRVAIVWRQQELTF